MGRGRLRNFLVAGLVLAFCLGCALPSPATTPPLTAAAAQKVLDSWNPNYCQVVEFYGFYVPAESAANYRIAYVQLANPGDKSQKPAVYEAQFQLLTRPDGQQRWYLMALTTHSSGLSRRQGWDNLIIPVPGGTSGTAP